MTFLRLLAVLFCAMLFLSCGTKPNVVETDTEDPSVVPEVVVQADTEESEPEATAEKPPVAEVSKTKEMEKTSVVAKEETKPMADSGKELAQTENTPKTKVAEVQATETTPPSMEETQVAMVEKPKPLSTILSDVGDTSDEESPVVSTEVTEEETETAEPAKVVRKIPTEINILDRFLNWWLEREEVVGTPPVVSVCDRSPDIRTAIVEVLDRYDQHCDKITAEELQTITHLKIINRQIKELAVGDFEGLVNLEHLALYKNLLTELPEGLFEGLENLRHLSLYRNEIRELSKEHLKGLNNLEFLNIHHNQISSLPKDLFEDTPNLKKFFVYTNQLTYIEPGTFNYVPNLQELKLDRNPLVTAPEVGVFAELNSLEWISLQAVPFIENYSEEEKDLLRDHIKQESGSETKVQL